MIFSPLLVIGLLIVGIVIIPEGGKAGPSEDGCFITVVYDNYQVSPGLITGWGFGCVIQTPTRSILFDTGGGSSALLSNMEKLNINPQGIETVVISHIHGDHLGGLGGFLERNGDVKVYVPASFPNSIKEGIQSFGAECPRVGKAMSIVRNAFSTGEMGAWIKEQSLVLDTSEGVIVMTGCAHPGIVNIIRKTKEILPDREISLVMGGFHLGGASDSKLRSIIREFRDLGVQRAGPCHCSGDRCRELFRREYKEDYVEVGVGRRIAFENIRDPQVNFSEHPE
jgi:7,8-dihydropterin-6-yl-methyl-4-(beta-D-ribofuranosyl)aminobenzene 5'-phosphate synthase